MQKLPIVIVFFLILSGNLFFYLTQRQTQNTTQHSEETKKILASETQKESKRFPARLKIPKINVDAVVEYVGSTPEGEMEVPRTTVDVAWYKFGPSPGERGSAVIAGHFNGVNGAEGVFAHLDKLKAGDKLYIEDDKGTTTPFVVRESRTYLPGYADHVFSQSDIAHLNLITCDGVWDENKKTYSKRLVVFADISSKQLDD